MVYQVKAINIKAT